MGFLKDQGIWAFTGQSITITFYNCKTKLPSISHFKAILVFSSNPLLSSICLCILCYKNYKCLLS